MVDNIFIPARYLVVLVIPESFFNFEVKVLERMKVICSPIDAR